MKCFECNKQAEHKHHVVPASRGGTKTVNLCGQCHAKAHHLNRNMSNSQLIKDVMKLKKANNKRIGSIPYGYDLGIDDSTLIKNEYEQAVIKRIKSMRFQELSLRQIAKQLTKDGVKTKKGGVTWCHTAVCRILDRN